MPRETQSERTSRAAESRAHQRVKVHSLAYVELGDGNAGLILNISETGMAVQAVQMLTSNHLPKMQFRLPKTDTLIEASGKVIWQIRSKKEAGIAFAGLSDKSRGAIKAWISSEQSRIASSAAAEQNGTERPPEATPVKEPYFDAERPSPRTPMNSPSPEPSADIQNEIDPDVESNEDKQVHVPELPADRGRPADRVETPTPFQRGVPTHWRVDAAGSRDAGRESRYRERPMFERTPAMPRWNGRIAPGVGMEFKKPRRWWTYTATLGLLAAVGFAGLMAIDPSLISRARIDALMHESNTAASGEQAADQNSPTPAQANSPAENPNPDSSGAPVQPNTPAQSAPQAPPPSTSANARHDLSANEQPSAAPASSSPRNNANQAEAAVPEASSPKHTTNPAGVRAQPSDAAGGRQNGEEVSTSAPPYSRTRPPQSSGSQTTEYTSQRGNDTSRSAYGNRANETAPAVQGGSASTAGQPASSANTREAGRNPEVSSSSGNGRVQPPARTTTERESPIDTWRAQTAQPSTPGPASGSRSSGTAVNQQQATRPQPVQDAYARSTPYAPPRSSNASRGAASASGVAVVEVPSYQSSPVPPSMPLAGVPSGSVAATSQFRAVLIPPSLAWTRSQLPGNLQTGSLVSSYSPAYPIEAAREGIEGVVKLEVTVGMDGTVRSVRVLSGPAMLSSTAVSAVRDWRYGETFLASRAVETEQYVSMVFRLASAR